MAIIVSIEYTEVNHFIRNQKYIPIGHKIHTGVCLRNINQQTELLGSSNEA